MYSQGLGPGQAIRYHLRSEESVLAPIQAKTMRQQMCERTLAAETLVSIGGIGLEEREVLEMVSPQTSEI